MKNLGGSDDARFAGLPFLPASRPPATPNQLETNMASITIGGNEVHTVGTPPAEGAHAPSFDLTGVDLGEISLGGLSGQNVVLNIFPSIDTPTCAASVRAFNERAAALDNTTVLCVSADLPFAQQRFCGAEGIDGVLMGSTFRTAAFGKDYGLTMGDGPMAGLLARAVLVVDGDGQVVHSQLVPELADEPDYDEALAAL
ncbi:putative peroxiredoxin [Candidatus Microthrix parvicella RN1]|jgi:thiol peroxidase|uniref:Thiol peroxidase n=2 Tax=Microthrixaceae TaxID=1798913 RepID=R4YYJ7_9ACTN|nr:putative peroxiredoxin [Candidatus Microthrix parvicella RN1]